MRFALPAILLALVGGLGAVAAPPTSPATASFRLADGSAGCNFLRSGAIACRAEGAPRALVLEANGDTRTEGISVTWNDATRVLLEGESWWNGDVSCRVRGAIVCATANGGQIAVAADGVGALAPPVQATLTD